ncbi:MAG TPA: M28 family peptidase, partial [Gemmatimonadales bacterium]|nr:M28 family peptidase [Gemmatimonadales bacterium]
KLPAVALLALVLALTPANSAAAQASSVLDTVPLLERAAMLAEGELSGERALETVAFVEQRWRLPGNSGFNESLDHVVERLESAGFVPESASADARLTYRVERRPMQQFAWEPVDATLTIVGADSALLRFESNRNMLAINSFSTPAGGVEGELVDGGDGSPAALDAANVRGKVVFARAPVSRLYQAAVVERGALGVLAYSLPDYLQPQVHVTSIQFGRIPQDTVRRGWAMLLSHAARAELERALAAGPVRVRARAESRLYESEERMVVADVRGRTLPHERFVFSAHVQEPGANDNASGVGAQTEMARALAALVQRGDWSPERTITFLWGNEIAGTRDYLADDSVRTSGVRWGMSLDMVGENTAITGGTFLIEKMPDPSAIWTRGEDRHSEWGGRPIGKDELMPHFLNDFVLARCRDRASRTNWVVNSNPFEGGSDHTPFLRANIPAVLFWHFTDVFYHTDNDRLDKVSPETLENVASCALTSALALTSGDGETARAIATELAEAAEARIAAERELGMRAIANGEDAALQRDIISTWARWYRDALATVAEVEVGGSSAATRSYLLRLDVRIAAAEEAALEELG